MKSSYLDGYYFDTANMFRVKVWKADHLLNRHIKGNKGVFEISNSKGLLTTINLNRRKRTGIRRFSTSATTLNLSVISKLLKPSTSPKPFYTMEIETLNHNGYQTPFLITCKVTSRVKPFITSSL